MTGPGDGVAAAGGRGRLRASHADRERVISVLKAAFVQGRLAKDELDARGGCPEFRGTSVAVPLMIRLPSVPDSGLWLRHFR
jgi:uncharacterized protein (UPF0261 family)